MNRLKNLNLKNLNIVFNKMTEIDALLAKSINFTYSTRPSEIYLEIDNETASIKFPVCQNCVFENVFINE